MKTLVLSLVFLISLVVVAGAGKASIKSRLRQDFYRITSSCPQAEKIVKQVTWEKARRDPTLGAKLLRVHYHDCFVKGCDASILLDSRVGTNQTEKDARPNLTLKGFDVIDEIKTAVEKDCPGIVSCADILALAARDAVSFPFKRLMWDVLTGRKDGKVSLLSNVNGNLPSPFSGFQTLKNIFGNKSLDINDLVALSGAHTIGAAHCGAFSRRLNFTGKGDTDPSLDSNYAAFSRTQCPSPANPATIVDMDPKSSLSFDSHYFTTVSQKRGLFQSDAALLDDPTSTGIVNEFQSSAKFLKQFRKSMIKMGEIDVLVGHDGEIRKNCRVVNP